MRYTADSPGDDDLNDDAGDDGDNVRLHDTCFMTLVPIQSSSSTS